MAKKKQPDLRDIFTKTEPEQPQPEAKSDPVHARGIGLRESEWERIEAIAREMQTNAHALTVWAVRDFLKRYEKGELPITRRPTLPDL